MEGYGMKRALLVLLVLVCGLAVPALAQDAAPVAEAVEAAAPVADAGGTVLGSIADVVAFLLPMVGTALGLLAIAAVWKLLGKLGIQKTAELNAILTSLVKKAINATEAWAIESGKKGNEKLHYCLDKLREYMDGFGLPAKVEKFLVDLVEGQLARDKAKGGDKV
jgi:hypothetical protein